MLIALVLIALVLIIKWVKHSSRIVFRALGLKISTSWEKNSTDVSAASAAFSISAPRTIQRSLVGQLTSCRSFFSNFEHESHKYRSYNDFLWYSKLTWTLFMGLWMPLSYMMGMNNDRQRSMFIATSMNTHHVWSMIIEIAMITDRQWSLIITDIVIDQWLLLWNAVDHTWSVLINGLYHDPYKADDNANGRVSGFLKENPWNGFPRWGSRISWRSWRRMMSR